MAMVKRSLSLGILAIAASAACSTSQPSGTTTGTSTSAGSMTSGTSTGAGSTTTTTGGTTGSSSGTTTGGGDAGCGCDAGYCDPQGTGNCLQCLDDTQCTAPKGTCQTSPAELNYGKCVECTPEKPQCPTGQVCDLSIGSTYQQCVADCRLDAGIPPCPFVLGEPQHCVQATGTCAPRCNLNIDCGADAGFCLVDAGLCVPCLSATDCPYSQAGCSSTTNQCGACVTTADCPAGLSCVVLFEGPPVQASCVCLDSAQCGGNAPVCLNFDLVGSGDGGFCGCVSNADCAAQDGLCALYNGGIASCFPSCADGGTDCSSFNFPNQFCNMATGACGPCLSSTQCQGNVNGAFCGPSGRCGCLSDIDCAPNDVCNPSQQCVPSCALDAGGTNCANFYEICDPATGQCVGCLSDSDCASNVGATKCLSDIDAGNYCVGCFTPADCPASMPGCSSGGYYCGYCAVSTDCPASAPLCDQGICVVSCTSDAGTGCDSGVCQTSTGFCVTCLDDTECQSQASTPYCASDVDAGNFCIQCRTPTDCPSDMPGCSSQGYFCGGCASSADCPASNPYCQFGVCGASCVLPDGGNTCPYAVCDTTSGLCVGCLINSDCQPSTYCLLTDAGNSCVQCLDSSQCTPWPCNTAPHYNFCGSCGSDSDCPSEAPHCSTPPNGSCTDGG
jgi:hypothetical protein